jgi:hypothetical protein
MGKIQGSIVHRIFPKAPFFPDLLASWLPHDALVNQASPS